MLTTERLTGRERIEGGKKYCKTIQQSKQMTTKHVKQAIANK